MYVLSRKKVNSTPPSFKNPNSSLNNERGLRQVKNGQMKPKTKPSLKIQGGQKTSAGLVAIARKIFSSRGYSDTAMEEIVRKAGVTRGALYHHFDGKKALFLAAFEDAQSDIANRIIQGGMGKRSAWEKLISCTYAFFEACRDSELQRIVLVDAPAILGWDVWRRVDEEKTLHILRSLLTELIDKGIIKPLPVEPLTHLVSGAANEAVLWIAGSEDPKKAFEEAWFTMKAFLWSLRK
jgi:AcrR family transcriptional regulator